MKTLIDKIRNAGRKVRRGVKRGILVAAAVASLGVAGCDLNGPKPVPNYAPVASLNVNPNPVVVDSPTYMTLNGTDENGIEDIVEYKIGVDKNDNNQIDADEEIRTQIYPITDFPVIFNESGVKTILGQVTDSQGAKAIDVKPITVSSNGSGTKYNISGFLQDNETDTNQIGETRVYINGIEDFSQRDNDGNGFTFSVPSGSDVKIKGMIKNGDIQKSYVRTVNLENVIEDKTVLVKAVPYPTFCIDADFKTFMEQINGTKLIKWISINGVGIFTDNPFSNPGAFNSSQISQTINKIISPTDVELYLNGKKDFSEDNVKNPPTSEMINGDNEPNSGYITVVPDNSLIGGYGRTSFNPSIYNTGIIDKAIVYIKPLNGVGNPISFDFNNPTISHEFGHVFIAPNGEASILRPYTIMYSTPTEGPSISTPGYADKKAAKIVYEDTYSPGENLDNILGMDF